MRLVIPHPGHFSALKDIIEYKEANRLVDVAEVYMAGLPQVMGSGRATLHAALIDDIREQTEYAHQHGIKMNIVMNASCLGGHHLTFEGYRLFEWYFNELDKMGVDGVTVAEPYLVELLKEYSMETVISCVSHVDSPQRAVFYEALGADCITVDTNINRDFSTLKAIMSAVSCNIRVIVNEGCLYKCPFRYAHFNLFSHITASASRPLNTFADYYFDKCISIRVRDPSQIIRSPWIRPEDIAEYERIGIDDFKLAGRANAVGWILSCMEAYSRRSYDGNLLELLDCPSELRDIFYVDNKALDGCIKRWQSCNRICDECRYCDDITGRALKVIK